MSELFVELFHNTTEGAVHALLTGIVPLLFLTLVLPVCGPGSVVPPDDDTLDDDAGLDDDLADDDAMDTGGTGTLTVTYDLLAVLADGQTVEPEIVVFAAAYVPGDAGSTGNAYMNDPDATHCAFPLVWGLWDPAVPPEADPHYGTSWMNFEASCRVNPTPTSHTGIAPPAEVILHAGDYFVGVYIPSIATSRFVSTLDFVHVTRDARIDVHATVSRDLTGTWVPVPNDWGEENLVRMVFGTDDMPNADPNDPIWDGAEACPSRIWGGTSPWGAPCLLPEDHLWVSIPDQGAVSEGVILEAGGLLEMITISHVGSGTSVCEHVTSSVYERIE